MLAFVTSGLISLDKEIRPITMAFEDPLQWIIIGVVVIVIFLWGPNKIPELAKGLGRAKKEFDMASKGISDPLNAALTTATTTTTAAAVTTAAPAKSTDEILLETAQQLGIATQGKTREQIAQEIVWKTKGT